MKKLIYILFLLPFLAIGQVSNGTEFEQEAFKATNPQTVTSSSFITTTGTDGTQGKILGENITLSVIPPVTNFTPVTSSIKGYFQGVDNKLGSIVQTTAGITNRIYFTGDITTLSAVNYFTSNAASKGAVATASPTPLSNNDNEKKYFTQDIIGNAFPSIQKFPAGTYAGNLTVRVSPNSAQQRYTVEIYKANTLGAPIASGITGAPVGDLGVTVVAILDSGLINLTDNAITNIPVNGILASELTINATERIRYHVSAAKVGTAGNNITMEVFYGSNYNSYYDVPVTFDTNSVKDVSTVTNGTRTVTDALNTLNSGKEDVVNKSSSYTVSSTTTYANTKALVDGLATKQNTLTNPVTGSGSSGYVSFWTGTTTQGSDNSFYWDNMNKRLGVGGVPAYGSIEVLSPSFGTQTFAMFANDGLQGSRFLIQNITSSGLHRVNFTTAFNSGTPTTTWSFDKGNLVIGSSSASTKLDVIGTSGNISKFASSTNSVELNVTSFVDIMALQSYFYTTSAPRAISINPAGGRVLVGTSTDDGVNQLQISGAAKISSLAGTGTRQVVADASGNLSATNIGSISGSYTPVISNTTNVASSSPLTSYYTRVGNVVTVTINAGISVTTGSSDTSFDVTLPVSTTLTSGQVGSGTFRNNAGSAYMPVWCILTTGSKSNVHFTSNGTGTHPGSFTIQYSVN